MVHVQYRGSPPALTDLLGGQVQVFFASTTIAIEHIWTGKLRALAVTTAERSEALPDIPTLGEFLPGTGKERLALPPNPSYSLL
jgi:tripartite-type tricarboxylate transporter receptor subunit TctC